MNAPTILTALAAVCLAFLVVYELRPVPVGSSDPASGAAATAGPASGSAGIVSADRAGSTDTLLSRPLFSQTRHPGAEAGPVAADAAPSTPLPRMTGIMIDGTHRSAMFAGPAGGKSITVAEGGRVGAFTVESIGPQQVVVLGPEGQRIVHTSFDATLPVPVASPFVVPQFPGIVLPGTSPLTSPITSPITSPGGRLPGGGLPQFNPPGSAGFGAAR